MTDICYVEISSILCDHIECFSLKSILVYTTTKSPLLKAKHGDVAAKEW